MGVRSDYKKTTTKECHYCDYLTCRKGHKCKWYKKHVKKIARKRWYRIMNNPCKHCLKANLDFINDNEYGCDTPCKSAKDFWNTIGRQFDDLLERARDLLKAVTGAG